MTKETSEKVIKEKIRLCKKHNITLVAIYPQDLISQQKLESKLSALITKA